MNIPIPPQNLDAERCVLGSLMLLNSAFDEIDLHASEFYSDEHRRIFSAFADMWRSGCRAIDAVTLAEELLRRDELEAIGGAAYIAEVVDSVPHAAHIRHYAKIVREKAQQRQLIYACTETIQKAYSEDTEFVLSRLESQLLDIRKTGAEPEIATIADALLALEDSEATPSQTHTTGLPEIDHRLNGGFRGGQFVVIAARPGGGKSMLCAQMAAAFARRDEPSLVVSLEMTRTELAERYDKSIDRRKLRDLPIHIVDSVYDADSIAGVIRIAHRNHGIKMAVIDYLQLAETSDRNLSRERQVAAASRTCKRLAMELQIPILAACQLNRAGADGKRSPQLAHLRESGAIEQDADIVLLLESEDVSTTKVLLAKHRNGATGRFTLTRCADKFKFESPIPDIGRL